MIERIKERFTLLFSLHYKIERFGVMLTCLLALLGMLVGSVVMYTKKLDSITLGNQVMYTTNVEFSLSGNTGTVNGIWVSEDQTQAFVLLHMDSTAKLVTDVDQYQVFICGSDLAGNYEALQSHPTVGIYMFSDTGYMGFYLVDTGGFPAQIMNMTIRCNKLVGNPRDNIPVYDDRSFNKFDQAKVFFNPGGAEFTTAAFLNEYSMTAYDIIEGSIVDGQEATIRASLDDSLLEMQGMLSRMEEYSARLESYGVIVPQAPIQIRGDSVTADEDGNLSLNYSYLCSGGFDFDWRSGSVREGYLADIVPENYRYDTYLTQMSKAANKETFTMDTNIVWRDTAGNVISTNSSLGTSTEKSISENTQALVSVWQEYFLAKQKYQTELLPSLLILELQVQDMSEHFGVKSSLTTTVW